MKKLFIILLFFISIDSFGQASNNGPKVFNVKLFGAKGDGVTDDTRKIQLAINAAYAVGGGQVFFPNGKYLIHDTLNTTSVFSGGIRYGGSNSQLYIPDNQTPFSSNPLVSIEFIGEESPNTFTSILLPYGINQRGVILYSDITGSGTYPSLLGAVGDAWTYGNINDAQVSVKNINFRVKANITGSGPTMSAVNLYKVSSIGYMENVLCDVDTSSNYLVYPSALTFGIYMPYANNSAFNPIQNCNVTGYKYGFIFSEHTVGNNLYASACEYGYLFTGGPHSQQFGRLGAYWNKYSLANGSANFPAGSPIVTINSLDVETDTTTAHWWKSKYIIYDSTNGMLGNIKYYIVQSPNGTNASSQFNKLGGGNALLQLSATGAYPDTITRFTGFATLGKTYNDSLALKAAIPAQFNPIAGTDMSLSGSYPNITFNSTAASAAGNWTTSGANNIYRPTGLVGIGTVPLSKLHIRNDGLTAAPNDSTGILIQDSTAATVGVQSYSPPIVWAGKGWKTTATAASQDIRFRQYLVPVQGAANPTANLVVEASTNGGAYVNLYTLGINSSGNSVATYPSTLTTSIFNANGVATFGGTIVQNNAGAITLSGITTLGQTSLATTSTDGFVINNSTNATSGVPVQYSGRSRWTGRAWDGAATKTADFIVENEPVNGTNPITANWVLKSQINAGGYNTVFTMSDVGKPSFNATNTTVGTTGNQTINKASGTVNIAAAGTAVTVTNSLVTASSIVFAVIRTNDATARISNVVPAAGSFVINIVACTAEVSIGFFVIN